MTLLSAVGVWLVLMAAEVVHGIARTLWLAPVVGDFRARQIAVFTGSILVLSISILMARWMGVLRRGPLAMIGVLWVMLTLAFEIGLGRLMLDFPWSRIAADYDVRHGGLLPFGLLVMALAPLLAARFRAMNPSSPARQHRRRITQA